jgi:ABC-2 type transport system permease protein
MSAVQPSAPRHPDRGRVTRARRAGTLADIVTVGLRALRGLVRDPEAIVPPLLIAGFFYAINVGSLTLLTEGANQGFDYKAFQLPTAVVFGITGISRAQSLVVDIQEGYFDRLLVTPVRRVALLLGLLVADFVLAVGLTLPVLAVGHLVGVRIATGIAGAVALVLLAGLWAVAFSGFSYAIALRTGNPAAVGQSFLIFFPFAFLTTAYVPESALSSWIKTVATYNPVTYLLDGMRDLVMTDWDMGSLVGAAACILAVGVLSLGLAFAALRGRVNRR